MVVPSSYCTSGGVGTSDGRARRCRVDGSRLPLKVSPWVVDDNGGHTTRPTTMATLRPLPDLRLLDPPLNDGEIRVAAALSELDDGWTIYVQPRLDMDVPDFVAVHDQYGVCAIEVKDWSPRRYRQADCGTIEYITGDGVWQTSKEQPSIRRLGIGRPSSISTSRERDNGHPTQPFEPSSSCRGFSDDDAHRLLTRRQVTDDEFSVAIRGGDGLIKSLEQILRGTGCTAADRESDERLRRHLRGSEAVREIRQPATLSPDAKNIADDPRDARRRRIRGPAGCGKTFGLAARATACRGRQDRAAPGIQHDALALPPQPRHGAVSGVWSRRAWSPP